MSLPLVRCLLLALLLVTLTMLPGCSTMLAGRTIERFAESLEAGDFGDLQAITSERFAAAALPDADSLATFDLVKLPVEDVTIDEVEELSETHHRVRASVGQPPQTLVYDLKRTARGAAWQIDEITMKRGQGKAAVSRTVSEQMQLLIATRDLIRAWQRDDLAAAFELAESPVGEPVETLPAPWQQQLAGDFFGDVLRGAPKASLVDGQARIDLPHKSGRLRLLLAQADDSTTPADASTTSTDDDEAMAFDEPSTSPAAPRWVLRTAVIAGERGRRERDLRTEARQLATAAGFLAAMDARDVEAACSTATDSLAANTLRRVDLATATEPFAALLTRPYDLRVEPSRSELTLEDESITYRVTIRTSEPGEIGETPPKVEEMTTWRDGTAVRLTAALTLEPTIAIFQQALLEGNARLLGLLSIERFGAAVWSRWQPQRDDVFAKLIVEPLPGTSPRISWNGGQVNVRYALGDDESAGSVTFRLRSAAQKLLVEDVLTTDSATSPPRSLRLELACLLTLDEMADGLLTGNLAAVRAASTPGLSRLVWDLQAPEDLPPGLDLLPIVGNLPQRVWRRPAGSLGAASTTDDEARGRRQTVFTGDDILADFAGHRVVLREHEGRLCIDDVLDLTPDGREAGRFTTHVRKHRVAAALGE